MRKWHGFAARAGEEFFAAGRAKSDEDKALHRAAGAKAVLERDRRLAWLRANGCRLRPDLYEGELCQFAHDCRACHGCGKD